MELRQRWSTEPIIADKIAAGDLVVVNEGEREILALAVRGRVDSPGIDGFVLLREFGPPSGDKIPTYCGVEPFRSSAIRRLTGKFLLDPPKGEAELALLSGLVGSPTNGMLVVFAGGERAVITAQPAGRWMAFDLSTGELISGKSPAFRLPAWRLMWVTDEDVIELIVFA